MKEKVYYIRENPIVTLSRFISWILTPSLIPLLAFVVLFWFSYLRIMPMQYKLIVLGVIYCFTILAPTVTIFLFRRINGFGIKEMSGRKGRYIPFILTIISYAFCLLMMRQLNIPWYMTGIIFTALVVYIVCTVANLKWKLSEHMAGMGCVIGGVVAFSELFDYNPVWWLCLFIFIAGALGSARVILSHHTLGEVVSGFFVGLACSLLILHPLSSTIFRYFLF